MSKIVGGGGIMAMIAGLFGRGTSVWSPDCFATNFRYGRAPKKRNGRPDTGVARKRRAARKARNKKG